MYKHMQVMYFKQKTLIQHVCTSRWCVKLTPMTSYDKKKIKADIDDVTFSFPKTCSAIVYRSCPHKNTCQTSVRGM